MVLTKKARGDLHEILCRDYGVSINDSEAEMLGVSLLRLTSIVCRAQIDRSVHGSGVFIPEVDTPES